MTKLNFANQLPSIIQPERIDDILDPFLEYIKATFNCHRIGIIQSFNSSTQLATIKLVDLLRKDTYQGQQLIQQAVLINCPVFIPYGSNGGLNLVIKSGLECLVLFNDRDLENWKITGGVSAPKTYRMHETTDALCLIGFRSIPKAIAGYDNLSVGITYVDDTGTEQAKVKVDTKVKIANNTQSLKDLIANLISILQNLKTVNGASQYSIDATTSTNLSTLLTNFNELLK